MERVQFQQEQMLDELKDLVEKQLFTEKEIKEIMKKRTAFETALVRRIAKKADFLRYASYEMGLEQLRRKRAERTKSESTVPSVSDYALVRRQFHIFERALKKFKSDVGLWIQYIEVAQREGARALVGRITARALQLHTNQPSLYILAASHELSYQSSSSARTLLQRGIRLNEESIDLWREYVKMELGFIESLRRRWDILGINEQAGNEADPSHNIMPEVDETAPVQEVLEDDADGADSRGAIMQGAIVKSVITSAVQALPRIELFEAIKTLVTEYPSAPLLRESILEHLYDELRQKLPDHAGAIKLLAGRFLKPDLKGEELVDGLRRANEEMLCRAENGSREDILEAYAEFVEEWCGAPIDDNMKEYLSLTLGTLAQQRHARISPSLLAAHIRLMTKMVDGDCNGPAKVLRTARKYTKQVPKSGVVWLARLEAEKRYGDGGTKEVWKEARGGVEGSVTEVEAVWRWGLGAGGAAEERVKTHEELLRESMRNAGLHETLLMSYVEAMHEVQGKPGTGLTSDQRTYSAKWLHSIRHMASAYLTSGAVWQKMFTVLGSAADGKGEVVEAVYKEWERFDKVEATLGWARWLLSNGRGQDAVRVVKGARGEEVERRWREMCY